MINIIDKKDCVGCNACVQRCPKQCISMLEDEQGFLYPKVDLNLCINCDICVKVCPVINQAAPREPLDTYAAKNADERIRMSSSSGGIFYALAKSIIDDNGVVFGAKFDENWNVVHSYAETLEDIKAFQGSKYVQSRIGDTYVQAEKFLKAGRKVMFTGTPCQIAGLGLFLRKDYGDQLLKVDVACHGVPSPRVWRDYLKYITRPEGASGGKNTFFSSLKESPVITGISFRDKRLGWEKYGFSVNGDSEKQELLFETLDKNIFMRAFLKNLNLRPSCYQCPSKSCRSMSDITLADFWGLKGVDKSAYDRSGVSMFLVNSKLGADTFSTLNIYHTAVSYDSCIINNSALIRSASSPSERDEYWSLFQTGGVQATFKLLNRLNPNKLEQSFSFCKRLINRILKAFNH